MSWRQTRKHTLVHPPLQNFPHTLPCNANSGPPSVKEQEMLSGTRVETDCWKVQHLSTKLSGGYSSLPVPSTASIPAPSVHLVNGTDLLDAASVPSHLGRLSKGSGTPVLCSPSPWVPRPCSDLPGSESSIQDPVTCLPSPSSSSSQPQDSPPTWLRVGPEG